MTTLRPFEDLIKPIEFEGETFIPIEEIFLLQLFKESRKGISFIKSKTTSSQNKWVKIQTSSLNQFTHVLKIIITTIDNIFFESSLWKDGIFIEDMPIYQIVQIVKNLIKWGFVEP
jgi:hypothetical protein